MSVVRKLFGGAITVELPSALVDVSTIREVPDTQEVFITPTTNASYVVEILQRVEPVDPKDAARFHFDALAADNEATASSVSSIEVPDLPSPPFNKDVLIEDSDKDKKSATNTSPRPVPEKSGEGTSETSKEIAPKEELSTPRPILLQGSQTVKKFNRTAPDDVQIILALFRLESKSVDLVFTANLPVTTEGGEGMTTEQLNEAKGTFITAARSLRIVDFSLFV